MKAWDTETGKLFSIYQSTFPDGQSHVKVEMPVPEKVTLQVRIVNGIDLFVVLLAAEALRHAGAVRIHLLVTYLLGARMDRRIATGEPFTLKVVAECLRGRFDRITVVDPHSDVACALLDAEAYLPVEAVSQVLARLDWHPSQDVALCAPDAGASKRVDRYALALGGYRVVQCLKYRDSATGELSSFRLANVGEVPKKVLICDDICDGGRTFSQVAEILKRAGAEWVGLYATHGIFSRGYRIPHVDQVFTTDSYGGPESTHAPVRWIEEPWNLAVCS